jgi:serpin B
MQNRLSPPKVILNLVVLAGLILSMGCVPSQVGEPVSPTANGEQTVPAASEPDRSAPETPPETPPAAPATDQARLTSPEVPPADLEALVEGNRDFALDFYQAVRTQDGNLIFSPFSISAALAMAYAGAGSDTATEMAATLHFNLPPERLHPAFNLLDLELNSRGEEAAAQPSGDEEGDPFRLEVANSTWAQEDYPFLQAYLDLLALHYGSGLNLIDFSGDPEAARQIVNAWISEQTGGKIEDLIPPGAIDSTTALILANAIYFYAAWQHPFNEDLTVDGTFTLLDGSQVRVPMMALPQAVQLPYAEGKGFQAIELPYEGDTAVMTLIVPQPGEFEAFEAGLDSGVLSEILAALQPKTATVRMPSFSFENHFSLTETLSDLGMPAAFQPGAADFSGMDGSRDLFISDVIHGATIAVDEAGTEATAATVVLMARGMAISEIELVVDRPFIFLIRDLPTGQILFIGRVLNPEGS